MLGTSSSSPTSSRRQSPRRSRYDVDFMVMRLIIFSLVDASADHITDCVLQLTSAAERQSLLEEYRQCKMQQGRCEFKSRCDLGPTASPTRLLATVHAARARHAISLRDGGLRDIKVSKSPSQTETPVFGDQFSMEKIRFAEFGYAPYHMRPYSPLTGSTSFDIVSHRDIISAIFPRERLLKENITITDNTNPAVEDSVFSTQSSDGHVSEQPFFERAIATSGSHAEYSPTRRCSVSLYDSELTDSLEPLPPSCTTKWAPYNGSRSCGHAQPEWTPETAPFTHEIYDPSSNANWWQDDLRRRRAQLDVWNLSHLAETSDGRYRVETEHSWDSHLSLCDTYPVSSNLDWYKNNIVRAAERNSATALSTKQDHILQAQRRGRKPPLKSQAREVFIESSTHSTVLRVEERAREADSLKTSPVTDTGGKMFANLRLNTKQSQQWDVTRPQPTSIDAVQPRRRSILVHRDECQNGLGESSRVEDHPERPERHVHFALPPLSECTNEEPASPSSSDGCITPVDSFDEVGLLEAKNKANKFALNVNLPPSATTARRRFMSYLNALKLHC